MVSLMPVISFTRVMCPILVQIRRAGGLLQEVPPVARHVQTPVLLLDRRAADGRLPDIQVAAIERDETLDVVVGIILILPLATVFSDRCGCRPGRNRT